MKTDSEVRVIKILDHLEQAEKRVGDFYVACAMRWRDAKVYWAATAHAEYGHARMISGLKELVHRYPEMIRFADDCTPESIDHFTARAEELRGQAERGDITLDDAMNIASDLEEFMIEKCLSQAIDSGHEDFKLLREKIISEEVNHRALFKIVLEEMKAGERPD